MGKRGPVPKKTFMKVLSGNLPLKKEFGTFEDIIDFNPPPMPTHLSMAEKEVWNATIGLLRPLHVLEKIDGAVLAAYCCSYVRWQTAEEAIQKEARRSSKKLSLLAYGSNGSFIISPMVTISRRAQADMVAYAQQLGMTPSARMRIEMEKPSGEEDNPFENLKKRKDHQGQLDSPGGKLRQIGHSKE